MPFQEYYKQYPYINTVPPWEERDGRVELRAVQSNQTRSTLVGTELLLNIII